MTARTAQRFIGAVVILEAASTVLFLRAADYSLTILNDPARLLHAGARGADLLWLASVLDMLGYLAAIPVALYLRERFRGEPGSDCSRWPAWRSCSWAQRPPSRSPPLAPS